MRKMFSRKRRRRMEMSFSELRTKEVINTADGRKLGKICDMVFCYPENRILGFVVPGQRSFGSKKCDFFIELKNIVKIGDDVILVNVGCARAPTGKQKGCMPSPHTYGDNCRDGNGYGGMNGAGASFSNRRSYEDYE